MNAPDAEHPRREGEGAASSLSEDEFEAQSTTVTPTIEVDRFSWERGIRDHDDVLGNRLLVLLTLGIYMRADGTGARPSLTTLASKTGLHPGTVGRHLRWARGNGWLKQASRGHRRGDGIAVASVHRATMPTEALPRNENDVERHVEILNVAPGPLNVAEGRSQRGNECATNTVFENTVLRTSITAACHRCDADGFYKDGPNLFLCDHPDLAMAGNQ